MKSILTAVLILVGFNVFSQTVKNQPYAFNNYVELRDSLKLGASSNLSVVGRFMKVDTLADGSFYFAAGFSDTITTIQYDSVLNKPFIVTDPEINMVDTNNYVIIGGQDNQFGRQSSLYVSNGIEERMVIMSPNETMIDCSAGSLFLISNNTGVTALTTLNQCPVGRRITIMGFTSDVGANTTTITTVGSIVLDPSIPSITLDIRINISFVTVDYGGGIILSEISRIP